MGQIELKDLNDRELLLLTAQKTNDIVERLDVLNGSVAKHEKRITALESTGNCEAQTRSRSKWEKLGIIVGITALVGTLLGGMLYAFGAAIGWW